MNDPKRRFSEKFARDRFDMIATFKEEARAREALGDLRAIGFTPQEALLLRPEDSAAAHPFSPESATFSAKELVADRAIAIWIIICTELAVGAIAGALIGWLIALFVNAPAILPIWFWMLIFGCIGAGLGILVGVWEWRKWSRELEELRQQVAIGLRFKDRNPAEQIRIARAILEQHGGEGMDNA
ncbi:MAG TPA: LapA family protein [Ktedonobacterales bacterium]